MRPAEQKNSPSLSDSDEELLSRFLKGESEAFGLLLRRHERELFGYLRRYLSDNSLAEDVFQTTFLQVYQKASQFDVSRKVRPWLYAIATHQAIDLLRKVGKRNLYSLDQPPDSDSSSKGSLAETIITNEKDPLEGLGLQESRERVQLALDQLPEHLKLVVILTYYQGLKNREVADIMNIPVGTVKSRLHTAMARLQGLYQGGEFHE